MANDTLNGTTMTDMDTSESGGDAILKAIEQHYRASAASMDSTTQEDGDVATTSSCHDKTLTQPPQEGLNTVSVAVGQALPKKGKPDPDDYLGQKARSSTKPPGHDWDGDEADHKQKRTATESEQKQKPHAPAASPTRARLHPQDSNIHGNDNGANGALNATASAIVVANTHNETSLLKQTSLGQPTTSTGTTVSMPGAYAQAPSNIDATTASDTLSTGSIAEEDDSSSSDDEEDSDIESGYFSLPTLTAEDSGLVVARRVEENEDLDRIKDLPQATLDQEDGTTMTSIGSPATGNKEQKTPWDQSKKQYAIRSTAVVGSAIVLVIVVVLLSVLLTKKRDEHQNTTPIATNPPPNTTMKMKDYILNLLPNYTQHAIETEVLDPDSSNDTRTPQAKALDWILQDPNLETYMYLNTTTTTTTTTASPRFFQRFALATVFYSTNGHEWQDSEHWLSYNVHECLWFAKNSFAFDQPPDNQTTYMKEYHNLIHRNPCELPLSLMNSSNSDIQKDHLFEYEYKHLWLHTNQLDGTLPPELVWLTSLRSLSLYANENLHGPFPPMLFGQLSHLEAVAIAYSRMTGTIPTEVGSLRNLHFFAALQNQFTGTVPSELGLLHPTLESMYMDGSQLTGTIPEELYNLTSLKTLYLSNNQLSGTLSTRVGQLTSIWDFQLQGNLLEGTIPSQVGNMQRMKRLMVFNNELTGTLSTELGMLSERFMVLDVHGNHLTGPVPSELGLLDGPNLQFHMEENQLEGPIPQEIASRLSGHLILWNVTGNTDLWYPEEDESTSSQLSLDGACWVNSTFLEVECPNIFYTHFSIGCWGCKCACPDAQANATSP